MPSVARVSSFDAMTLAAALAARGCPLLGAQHDERKP